MGFRDEKGSRGGGRRAGGQMQDRVQEREGFARKQVPGGMLEGEGCMLD